MLEALLNSLGCCPQAGGENTSRDLSTPAGLPKLFKSALDWNLYTNLQHAIEARQVRPSDHCAEGGDVNNVSAHTQKHRVTKL